MTFDTYYDIMKNHGIGELFFQFAGKDCAVFMELHNLQLIYVLSAGEKWESFDDLDKCVSAPVFGSGQCLRQIWNEIEILAVDGVSPEEYDTECSFDLVQYRKDQGELLWSCNLGRQRSFWVQMKYAALGAWILPVLSILYPLTGNSNWYLLYLTFGVGIFTLLLAAFFLYRNHLDINYQITTKKIFVFNGLHRSTDFENIRSVKLRRNLLRKDRGTIRLKLKKGLSLNYLLENIPDVDRVYQLLSEQIQ